MTKHKKIYTQISLFVMLFLSGGISALALISALKINKFIYSKEFFNEAMYSASDAYKYIEKKEYYMNIHLIASIVFAVFVLTVIAYYAVPAINKKRKAASAAKKEKKAAAKALHAQQTAIPAGSTFCGACGAKLKPNDKFCPKCGRPRGT